MDPDTNVVIYLDNAATSWPKPQSVYDTLGCFLQQNGANPGRSSHAMAVAASSAIASVRENLAELLHAESPDRIVFTASATDSLNMAISGLIGAGDRVVTSLMEHNSIRRPLRAMERAGACVLRVPCSNLGIVDIDRLKQAARGAQLIAITHASNVNGAVQPVDSIAEIARQAGALLLVDGAQTVGAMPLDVQNNGIDLLAFPGHKALLGPPGTGGLYIGPRVPLDDLKPLRSGGTGTDSESDEAPAALPTRYEAGTLNSVGIAALGAGLDYLLKHGIDESHAQHLAMTQRLLHGLQNIDGVRVFDSEQLNPAAVVSFILPGWSPAEVGAVLDQSFHIACRTGLHCAPDACRTIGAPVDGTVRFSPGHFSTTDEIDAAIDAVAQIAAHSTERGMSA